MLNKFSAR